jgi:hypothetical protein
MFHFQGQEIVSFVCIWCHGGTLPVIVTIGLLRTSRLLLVRKPWIYTIMHEASSWLNSGKPQVIEADLGY